MFQQATIKRTRVELQHTKDQYFGGYILYFKLFIQLLKLTFGKGSHLSKFQKSHSAAEFIFHAPYWLLIKPLGSLFSVRRFYRGFYELDNGGLERNEIRRTTMLKFLFLPIFFYWRKKIKRKEVFELMGEPEKATAIEIDSSRAKLKRNL